ncbi:hypothetical protein K0M31_017245 [Melipona bicolor]|uniref:Uncharacterized protein n=1 Tax=Melipona bicolor TaxID=60889 RepID=A0AA40G4H3_9HYME|nr:hypothetical protein K0M31_017245 [Melipona bicolor]
MKKTRGLSLGGPIGRGEDEEDSREAEESSRYALPAYSPAEKGCKWQAAGDDELAHVPSCWAAAFLHAAIRPHEAALAQQPSLPLRLRVLHPPTGCVRAGDAIHGRQTVSTALDERRSPSSRGQNIPFEPSNRVDIATP